jgi:transcriptional regulator with XRE-family HTH domain
MKDTIYENERYEVLEAMDDSKHHFMIWVKQRRRALKISQYHLAQVTGVGQSYLSELESGIKSPGLATAARIAAALNCKIVFEEIKKSRERRR